MTETFRLDTLGPHSDKRTIQAADALATSVRVLNHATRGEDGITDPATVCIVLGRIRDAIAGLDQLLWQLPGALTRLNAVDQLGHDNGDTNQHLQTVYGHAAEARHLAVALGAELDVMHTATSGMHLKAARPSVRGGPDLGHEAEALYREEQNDRD